MEKQSPLKLVLVEAEPTGKKMVKEEKPEPVKVEIPPEPNPRTLVMPMRPRIFIEVKGKQVPQLFSWVSKKRRRVQIPMRRPVDLYSWWQHKDKEFPVCIVGKDHVGQGVHFRCTHVRTLKIWESNPSIITIEDFWDMVDSGIIENVTEGVAVSYREVVEEEENYADEPE